MPEYVAALRVSEGVRRLRVDTLKVEAIALEAGYRSKRPFYRAVRRQTGLTRDNCACKVRPEGRALRGVVRTPTRCGRNYDACGQNRSASVFGASGHTVDFSPFTVVPPCENILATFRNCIGKPSVGFDSLSSRAI